MRVLASISCALALCSFAHLASAAGLDNAAWQGLLQRHVQVINDGNASQVDYRGMRAEQPLLREYLASTAAVSQVEFAAWSKAEQLAFLINVYNASTVALVLSGDSQISSIKELGSLLRSPWKQRFINLLGETRSLDDIEQTMIRGKQGYHESRIHFALNCASIGCPALRNEAYTGAALDQQLNDAQQHFLADRSRNRLTGQTLQVSSIFKWYGADFDLNGQGLGGYLASQAEALGLSPNQVQQLLDEQIDIEFLDYDWQLNRTP
jgi:hypothetical protein